LFLSRPVQPWRPDLVDDDLRDFERVIAVDLYGVMVGTRHVANTAVYLASERAAQITGIVSPVDGGTSTGPPPVQYDDIKPQSTADQ
jgi:hypothetical protein